MQPSPVLDPTLEDSIYQLAAVATKGRRQGRLYFAAKLSGLYYAEADGTAWKSAYGSLNLIEPLPTLSVASIPGDQTGPTVLAGYNGGLLRGRLNPQREWSWENIAFPEPAPALVALAVSPNYAEDKLIWAGTLEDGVYYSTDGGQQWQSGNFGLIDPNVMCLVASPDFKNDRALFVGTQSGLFYSHNAGRAWREVNLPNEYGAVISLALSPNFAEDSTLFAGTESEGLWRSTDRGQTWKRLDPAHLTGAILQISLSPDFGTELSLLALHDGHLVVSQNGGQRWQLWKEAEVEGREANALLAPQGLKAGAPILVGTAGGKTIRIRA